MRLTADNFDLWVFSRNPSTKFLLLRTSQEKADRFFGGSRFWQIPTDATAENEEIEDAARRIIDDLRLSLSALWAAEHTYTIYNRRRREVAIIPVFAAEVASPEDVHLSWEHSEFEWLSASECLNRVNFRGLKEGLRSVCEYITESPRPARELRLI